MHVPLTTADFAYRAGTVYGSRLGAVDEPTALVVLRDGATLDEATLISFCRGRLAGFQRPTSVEFCDSLPHTATGKVQKYLLRAPDWPA